MFSVSGLDALGKGSPSLVPLAPPPGFTASFRDVSLEKRCEALANFVAAYAAAYLPKVPYQGGGCGEGNGLGGARYNLDFHLGNHAYRFDVSFGRNSGHHLTLCDTHQAPTTCSGNDPSRPLAFQRQAAQPGSAAMPPTAANTFLGLHENAKFLLPTLGAWVSAPQGKSLIFDQEYAAFIGQITGQKTVLPVGDPAAKGQVQLLLKPAHSKRPERGSAVIEGTVSQALLDCFQCSSLDCINDNLTYRFEDRFFSIGKGKKSKTAPDKEPANSAGWVIEGAQPAGPAPWTYVCGASRYSLHTLQSK